MRAEAYPGGDLDSKTPPLTEIFFNLLGVFEKKTPKHHLNFTVHYKKIQNTPSKNFWVRPLMRKIFSLFADTTTCLNDTICGFNVFFKFFNI